MARQSRNGTPGIQKALAKAPKSDPQLPSIVTPLPASPGFPGARVTRGTDATRDRIIAEASKRFHAKGFDETTVSEIANAAGVSRRTVFRYFPSKVDLALPDAEEDSALLRNSLRWHHNPADPLAGMRKAMLDFGRWYDSRKDQLLLEWQYESRSPALVARGLEIEKFEQGHIAEALEAGGIPRVRARWLSSIIFAAIVANMQEWFENDCQDSLVDLGSDTLDLIDTLHQFTDPVKTSPTHGQPKGTPANARPNGNNHRG